MRAVGAAFNAAAKAVAAFDGPAIAFVRSLTVSLPEFMFMVACVQTEMLTLVVKSNAPFKPLPEFVLKIENEILGYFAARHNF